MSDEANGLRSATPKGAGTARLTEPQRRALDLLRTTARPGGGWGCLYGGKSCHMVGQAWINSATAECLEAKGLVEINREGIGWDVRAVAAAGSGTERA